MGVFSKGLASFSAAFCAVSAVFCAFSAFAVSAAFAGFAPSINNWRTSGLTLSWCFCAYSAALAKHFGLLAPGQQLRHSLDDLLRLTVGHMLPEQLRPGFCLLEQIQPCPILRLKLSRPKLLYGFRQAGRKFFSPRSSSRGDSSFLQPQKACFPIILTPAGMVTLVRFAQPEKALPAIFLTLSGMVTLVRPVQPQKAHSPITVTPAGIDTQLRRGKPEKSHTTN